LGRSALLDLFDQFDQIEEHDAFTLYLLPPIAADVLDFVPEEIANAAASSLTGAALLWGPSARLLVLPPFLLDATTRVSGYETEPLRVLLQRPRTIGVILARLGGYSVGLYRDGSFVLTKTGGRFVKNRHRKGGQSQRRFERIREGQIRNHFDDIDEVVRSRLLPEAASIDHIVLGGDRHTVQALLKRAPLPPALSAKLLPGVLDLPEPRLEILERTPGLIWRSRVLLLRGPGE